MSTIRRDEKIIAGLTHLSVFLSTIGLAAALSFYFLKRDDSSFIAHHAKQAASWQFSALILKKIIAYIFQATMMPSLYYINQGITYSFIAVALIGAYKAWNGQKYSYPVVGKISE